MVRRAVLEQVEEKKLEYEPKMTRSKAKKVMEKHGDVRERTNCFIIMLTLPKRQILDSSKLKEFADDNFKFDENCGKCSKWVENTVGKGEIARYEQFLLFPQCFQMTCPADT